MINQYEVPALLEDEFPALSADLKQINPFGSIYKTISLLTNYTKTMVQLHRFDHVKHCMQLAERLYERGNALVRNAVENVFVYAFSSMRTSCERGEWVTLQAEMPLTLHSLYVKQVLKTGI